MACYKKKGQAGAAVSNVISLIVGVGVAVMVIILISAVGGSTYNLVEPDIDLIGIKYFPNGTINESATDRNISSGIKQSMASSFEALEQTADYMPVIVLAVIISLVLALVLGMSALGGMRGNRGTAL